MQGFSALVDHAGSTTGLVHENVGQTNECYIAAMNSIKSGMLIKKAAEKHGVLTTNLQDQMHERVINGEAWA